MPGILKQLHSGCLPLVIVFCSLHITVMAQTRVARVDLSLSLPGLEDVEKVTIDPGSRSVHTPESLLEVWPHLVGTGGLYRPPKFPQRGTIRLKNGVVLRWVSISRYSIELQSDKGVRLFVVPAECSLTAPGQGLPLRPPGGRVFHHTGDISISYYYNKPSVALGYMSLEGKFDGPGLSAEFRCVDGRAADTVSLKFWSTRRVKGQPLALIADGRLLKRMTLHRPTDASLETLIVYTINLPRSLFLKMIDAATVKLLAGRQTFILGADHLEALRDLRSRMER